MIYALANVFEILSRYAFTAGITAAIIPTNMVVKNKIPSSLNANSNGLNAILKFCSVDVEIKYSPSLPTTIPNTNPITQSKILSNRTQGYSPRYISEEVQEVAYTDLMLWQFF